MRGDAYTNTVEGYFSLLKRGITGVYQKARFAPKERPTKKRKKKQHEKFVELARESGTDESEASFVAKVRAILRLRSPVKPRKPK